MAGQSRVSCMRGHPTFVYAPLEFMKASCRDIAEHDLFLSID